MNRTPLLVSAAGAMAVIILLRCLWLWQPERQVLKHHEHFLDSIEDRKWARVERFLDAEYGDRWGYNREELLRQAREVFRQFFALTITDELVDVHVADTTGTVRSMVRLEGTGSALAMLARDRANSITTPFVFEWRRRSWKPWDWKLVRVDNPTLDLERPSGF